MFCHVCVFGCGLVRKVLRTKVSSSFISDVANKTNYKTRSLDHQQLHSSNQCTLAELGATADHFRALRRGRLLGLIDWWVPSECSARNEDVWKDLIRMNVNEY